MSLYTGLALDGGAFMMTSVVLVSRPQAAMFKRRAVANTTGRHISNKTVAQCTRQPKVHCDFRDEHDPGERDRGGHNQWDWHEKKAHRDSMQQDVHTFSVHPRQYMAMSRFLAMAFSLIIAGDFHGGRYSSSARSPERRSSGPTELSTSASTCQQEKYPR